MSAQKKKKKKPRQKSKAAQATAASRGERGVERWERAIERMDGVEFKGSEAGQQAIEDYKSRAEAERTKEASEVDKESRKMAIIMGVIVTITMVILVGAFMMAGNK